MKKDKKIGILTFHASHNCGSFLQSYAMQNIIKKRYGYNVEIINFSAKGQQELYSVFSKKKTIKSIVKNALFFTIRKQLKQIFNSYENFINKNLILSKQKYSTMEELKVIDGMYDIYVCGSDQIWNVTCPDYDDSYFLPFLSPSCTKVAYAPSFGAMRLEEHVDDIEKYKNYLASFNELSIREINGKKWLEELTNREVELVLDPTLLLDLQDYQKLEQEVNINGEYIFYYSPRYYKEADKIVEKISKKYKYPVIMWNAKEWVLRGMIFKGFKLPENQNPGIYLSLIKNAKIVFTNSFHGAIFSSLYRKNFWVLKVGGMCGNDDRVFTLLKKINLLDRFLELDKFEEYDILKMPDYSKWDNEIEDIRKSSLEYLDKIMEKDND